MLESTTAAFPKRRTPHSRRSSAVKAGQLLIGRMQIKMRIVHNFMPSHDALSGRTGDGPVARGHFLNIADAVEDS